MGKKIEIELAGGYFIELEEMNHMLKQRFEGKTNDGKVKKSVKTHGYFRDLEQALDHFIKRYQEEYMGGMNLSLEAYVELVKHSNNKAVNMIREMIEER